MLMVIHPQKIQIKQGIKINHRLNFWNKLEGKLNTSF